MGKKRFIVTVTVKAITTNHNAGGKSVYWSWLLSVHNSPALTIQSH